MNLNELMHSAGNLAYINEIVSVAVFLFLAAALLYFWDRTLQLKTRQRTEEIQNEQDKVEKLNAQLKISNEELQTSNEELQSSYEELNLVVTDLDRKNIELSHQKEFNRTIINMLPSVLIVIDGRMSVEFVSENYKGFFGLTNNLDTADFLEEIVPLPTSAIADLTDRIRDVIGSGKGSKIYDFPYDDSSGKRRFLNITISPMPAGSEGRVTQVLMMLEDVTRLRELQIEVEENAAYLSGLVDNSLVAIITTDEDGRIVLFNEGAEKMTSYSKAEVREMNLEQLFSSKACQTIMENTGDGGRLTDYESNLKTKTDQAIAINIFAAALAGKESRRGTLIIAVDICERKKMEHQLLRRHHELSVRQAVNQGVMSSRDTQALSTIVANECGNGFNAGFCAVMFRAGTSGEFHCMEYIHPDRAAKAEGYKRLCEEFINRHTTLENADSEKVAETPQAIYGVEHLAVTMESRQPCAGIMIVADPLDETFDDRDQELLNSIGSELTIGFENIYLYQKQRSNLNYLQAINQITKAINSTLDSEEIFSLIVDNVRRLMDCPQVVLYNIDPFEQNVGALTTRGMCQDEKELEKIFPRKKYSRCIQAICREKPICCKTGGIDQPLRCKVKAAGDNFSLMCLPIKIEQRVVGLLQVWHTADELIGAEAADTIKDLAVHVAGSIHNANLYRDLQQSYSDLQHAQRQLIRIEKLRALGELSAGVAHDFNNVLAVILGNAQHLMEITEDKKLIEGLISIESASKDGANTIRRIQEFAQPSAGREESRFDLHKLVQDTLSVVQPRLKRDARFKGIKIEITTELQDAVYISADRNALREALMNILFNSVDALSEGGQINIGSVIRKSRVVVRIADDGAGMTDDVRERIFDPFFTTKGVKGLGLGMSIVYTAMQQNKGRIEVNSAPGEGTEVVLSFPVTQKDGTVPTTTMAAGSGKPANILLIDDNVEILKTLSNILEFEGHKITAYSDPEKAIKAFSSGGFDIVMTDIGMPDLSGWEVAKMINEIDNNIPVIFITGWGEQLDPIEVENAGVTGVINKPLSKDETLQVIDTIMTR
jgi:PAS domain S-box-containing protein